jgi:hypothetical protein
VTTTIGVLGDDWRAQVTAWGDVEAADRTIAWHVAADDRWHRPAEEATVRQTSIDATPVIETRVRIPGGDAIQRVWATADHGGLTVIEVENDSSMPIAAAFSGGGLLTSRPPAEVPIEGIDLPPDTILLPVGHRTRVRVALARRSALTRLPDGIAGPHQVAGGWLAHSHHASRLVLPDPAVADSVVTARCALALEGPDASDDAELLLGIGELVRMGGEAAPWVLDVAAAAQRVIDAGRRGDPFVPAALWAAAAVLAAAGEATGQRDVVSALMRLRPPEDRPTAPGPADRWLSRASGHLRATARAVRTGRAVEAANEATDTAPVGHGTVIDGVEGLIARPAGRGVCALFPTGIPPAWWGVSFEAHGLRAGSEQRLSVAVRWHGERPALLWELDGPAPLTLTGGAHDPSWRTDAASGEALLSAPPQAG